MFTIRGVWFAVCCVMVAMLCVVLCVMVRRDVCYLMFVV